MRLAVVWIEFDGAAKLCDRVVVSPRHIHDPADIGIDDEGQGIEVAGERHFAKRFVEPTLRAWADLRVGSMPLDSPENTSLSLAVRSSSRCLARYSATAVA